MVDGSALRKGEAPAVEAAIRGGVDWVQVRDRLLQGADLLALTLAVGRAAARGAAGREAVVIVNRRADVALAAQAAGVHLGFDAMPVECARALLGPGARIGFSAHAAAEVAARAPGASYAHLAPIFPPLSKRSRRPALGLGPLREAARSGLPVLAQGGIDATQAGPACAAGAAGVAVTGAVLQTDDPERAARGLRQALDRAAPH